MYKITCSVYQVAIFKLLCAGGDLRKEGCWEETPEEHRPSPVLTLSNWQGDGNLLVASGYIINRRAVMKKINLLLSFQGTKPKSRALEKLHYRHCPRTVRNLDTWQKEEKPIASNLHLILLLLATLDLFVYFRNHRKNAY